MIYCQNPLISINCGWFKDLSEKNIYSRRISSIFRREICLKKHKLRTLKSKQKDGVRKYLQHKKKIKRLNVYVKICVRIKIVKPYTPGC